MQTQIEHNIDAFLTHETQSLLPVVEPIVTSMFGSAWVPVVMAIIDNESGGTIGQIAGEETGISASLPMKNGGYKTVKKALGLMQVIPINIEDYAKRFGPVFYEDMTGTSIDAARIQIKIGCDVLRKMINSMIGYLPAMKVTKPAMNPDNLGFILMAYAIGQRPVQNMIQRMKTASLPLTLAAAEESEPNLGKPKNRPYFFAKKILKKISGIAGQIRSTAQSSDLFLVIAAGLTLFLIFKK